MLFDLKLGHWAKWWLLLQIKHSLLLLLLLELLSTYTWKTLTGWVETWEFLNLFWSLTFCEVKLFLFSFTDSNIFIRLSKNWMNLTDVGGSESVLGIWDYGSISGFGAKKAALFIDKFKLFKYCFHCFCVSTSNKDKPL